MWFVIRIVKKMTPRKIGEMTAVKTIGWPPQTTESTPHTPTASTDSTSVERTDC